MKATLTFKRKKDADIFTAAYSRHTKKGHIVGPGIENVEVTVFDVTDDEKYWINNYIRKTNNP